MYYHEHCHSPEKRTGTMVPRSALPDFFKLPDSGYASVYAFTEQAKSAVQAQGHAQGLSRFPVYSDRLWIDIDAADENDVDRVKEYTRELTRQFRALDYSFTVWDSGSKGFHLAVRIEPMFAKNVPWSQLQWIKTNNIACDFSLYQSGRLLSNPGRVHPKTGRKKTKVFEHKGSMLLTIPLVPEPERLSVDSDSLTNADLTRITLNRVQALVLDGPLPGNRHQALWSVASQAAESGMSRELVTELLLHTNKLLPQPKSKEDVCRAIDQAFHQLGL